MSTSQSLQQPHQQHPPPTAATVPANTAADTKHSGSLLYPTPLTPVQESLSQGTLMCYCAQVLPKESYITAVEEACTRLLPRVAEGIQSSFQPFTKELLPSPQTQPHNRRMQSHYRTQRGPVPDGTYSTQRVVMLVMDKQDYTDKALSSLADTSTYRIINKGPTTKLIQTLKDIKRKRGFSDPSYRKVYPTSAVPQSFMASPKYIKWAPP